MPTSALTPIWVRADVGIGPYELKSPNPDLPISYYRRKTT